LQLKTAALHLPTPKLFLNILPNSSHHQAQASNRREGADETKTACIVVGVDFGEPYFAESLDEASLLADTAGLNCVQRLSAKRQAPDTATFLGSGKVEELAELCRVTEAEIVVFANAIGPVQQRNLERAIKLPVIDRTGLILDIFAQRAQSHEGKLQVQLAQTQYQATRLVRQWSHLERQRGGIGMRGGPGERQLELDKRMLRTKVKAIRERLDKVQRQRDTQRRARLRSGVLRVAIVGYTNAGKSTLFSAVTNSSAYVANQLFATLDPTTRRMKLGGGIELAMSDTVGFVRDLPHLLVAAFKSTLQEAMDADLLLHVVDSSSLIADEQIKAVNEVLEEIGAHDIPQWLVYNKIDVSGRRAGYTEMHVDDLNNDNSSGHAEHQFHVSALTGSGVALLRRALLEAADSHVKKSVSSAMSQSRFAQVSAQQAINSSEEFRN
jgi:GTPase